MNTIAQMTWGQSALAWSLILVCGFLMLIILIQRGRGGGLTGAFGGGGGGGAFGAKTGDVFTWITVVVAVGFGLLAVVANFALDQSPQPLEPTVSAPDVVPVLPDAPATTGEDGTPVTPATGTAPEVTGEAGGEAVPDDGAVLDDGAVPDDGKETVGGSIIDEKPAAAKTPTAGGDEPAEQAKEPPADTEKGSEAPPEPSTP